MHLIQSLKNEFCFDLPMFSKYPATSINSYFYKMTLSNFIQSALIMMTLNINPSLHFPFWSDRSSLIVTGPRKTQGSVTDPKQFVNTQYTIYSLEQQNDMFRKLNLILNVKIKQPNWWMLVFFEMDNSTDFWFGWFYGKQHPILHVLVWLLVHITWIYVCSWLLMLSHILSIPIDYSAWPTLTPYLYEIFLLSNNQYHRYRVPRYGVTDISLLLIKWSFNQNLEQRIASNIFKKVLYILFMLL